MKNFFLALFTKLSAVTGILYVRMWNNQLDLVQAGKMELFGHPACFIEFGSASIQQLGEGRQLFDPLTFKIHILDWQLDAGDGTFEQNLEVYDLKDLIFAAIQKFQPGLTDQTDKVGSCIRIAEYQDYKHAGVYHYIQEYKTTYVDEIMVEPVGGIDGPVPPLPMQLNITTEDVQAAAVPYDATIQYLAASQTIVSNAGSYYIIKTDTPSPAGAFDATYWTYLEPTTITFTPT